MILPSRSKNTKHKDRIFLGIFCGILAFFCFAVMSMGAKVLSDTNSVFEISFYRCLITALPMAAFVFFTKRYTLFHVQNKKILLLRVILGILAVLTTFGTAKYLPLADATLLFMLATLITPAMAFFVLGENMGWRRWVAVIIGLIGVALVLQPRGDFVLIGTALGIFSALMHSSAQVMLRVLKRESSFALTFYFVLGGLIILAPFMPTKAVGFHNGFDMGMIFLVGISGGIGQYCLALAFHYAPASSVSPFAFSGLIWAILFDIIIWSITPSYPIFIGAAIIIAAKLYILRREHLLQKKENING